MAINLAKPILLTGASGNIGRQLAHAMGKEGWTLRLTDMAPFPDELPPGATFTQCDLGDGVNLMHLAEGCGLIVHFGGASHDLWPVEDIINANLRGIYFIYEAARREGARVIFASSNHTIGFHERTTRLDDDCEVKPDSLYGLSKVYGENMARLYWMKHAVESVLLRIGSCFPAPSTERMLSTWLSYPDVCSLVIAAANAPEVACDVIWGASDNSRSFWGHDARTKIGWQPKDSADDHEARLLGKITDNPNIEKYQGGIDTTRG